MATSSILVDIRANTQRALNDFKAFSAQLDNKFLISGLKLDVVRSALSQINKEFQKAIGEQGITAGQSLRAAENQASLIFSTFKSLGFEASQEISKNFSEELNKIAVNIGSTTEDVKKTLSTIGFLDINLPEGVRKNLTNEILKIQTDIRNAGLGDNFAEIIRGFLSKEVSAQDLINSGDPLSNQIGVELARVSGTQPLLSPVARSEAIKRLLENKELWASISETAKETAGYRLVLDRLKATLFNPRAGLFGALREISISAGEKTSLTKETFKLVNSVFGEEGLFVKFFKKVGEIVGIDEPDEVLKPVLEGVRWMSEQFENLSNLLDSPFVNGVVDQLKKAFESMKSFADDLLAGVGDFLQSSAASEIGKSLGDTFEKIVGLITTLIKGFSEFLTTSGGSIAEKAGKVLSEFIKLFGNIVAGITSFINSPTGARLGATISRTINTFLNVFLGIFEALSKAETLNALSGNITRAFDNVLDLFNAILDVFNSGKLDPTKINQAIGQIGTDIRSFIETLGEGLRKTAGNKEGQEFFGSVVGTIIKELAKTVGTLFREIFLLIIENLPQIISGIIGGIYTGLQGLFSGLFDNEFIGTILAGIATIGLGGWFVRLFRLRFLNPLLLGVLNFFTGSGGPLGAVNRALGGGRPPTGSGGRVTYSGGGGGVGRRTGLFLAPRLMAARDRTGEFLGGARDRTGEFLGGARDRTVRVSRGVGGFFRSVGGLGDVLGPIFTPQAPPERPTEFDIRDARIQERYNRRYGFRGTAARNLRRFGRFARGGAVGLAGAGIITAMTLLGGRDAGAEELDPMTGEPKKKPMGVGGAWGALGKGAAEGAMTGMIFGPWGAAIGGVIGAGMSLMDEGVRKTVMKSIADFANGVAKSFEQFIAGIGDSMSQLGTNISNTLGSFTSSITSGLSKAASEIVKFFTQTLPSWWLTGMRKIYIELPVQIGKFVTELGMRMISAVAGFDLGAALKNTWEAIKNAPNNLMEWFRNNSGNTPPRRFGGSVYEGRTYLVGENGPELFSPINNGTIIPNSSSNTTKPNVSNNSVTYNIYVTGGSNAQEIASIVKAEIQRSWESALSSSGPSGPNTVRL